MYLEDKIKRLSYLKLLGVTFQDCPTNWDKHFDDLMERALKRRVWGVAAYTKYLSQIDRLLRRAFRFGDIQHETSI